MYKKLIINERFNTVIRELDGASIPTDEANTDYQEYLKWVAEGNEAEVQEIE